MLRLFKSLAGLIGIRRGFLAVMGALCFLGVTRVALAKEPSLTAIELYNGTAGAAYVQLTDVLINAKVEMRSCAAGDRIDKAAYGKMPKVTIAAGSTLERGANGVLTLTLKDGSSFCAVPENVKFDKNVVFSASELADQAQLRGTIAAPSPDLAAGPPPLKNGVKLVFIVAPDVELAEYLRAQRAAAAAVWRTYLAAYPASANVAAAKVSLAGIYTAEGQGSLAKYKKAAAGASPAYPDLKSAYDMAGQALALVPDAAAAIALRGDVRAELTRLCEVGADDLQSYKKALADETAGYDYLVKARKLAEAVAGIDPSFPAGVMLKNNVASENAKIESALHAAEAAVAANDFDKAYALLNPYRSFADEEPRINSVVNAAYKFHFDKASASATAQDWQSAVPEFEKAQVIKTTPECAAALDQAKTSLMTKQNQDAAAAALANSKDREQQKDNISAYEVLAELPAAQRALVASDLARLAPAYIQSASKEAKTLQLAHDPIRGLADEEGIEKAYQYLQSSYKLSDDPAYKDRMEILANDLSAYYLQQAKHFLAKPAGSGTEVGWVYLDEALSYKAANLDAVRDARTDASMAHSIRSKLSLRVQFRDQTSQRDSVGFAVQMENAIITGLEASGLTVKVVRFGEATPVEPDFKLDGDVLQHYKSMVPTVEPKESKYLAGEHETPNEEWNKVNREYEAATLDLQSGQSALQGAQTKGKKKEIDLVTVRVDAAQKKVADAHAKLDSISKTITSDVTRPYTYTKKTLEISGVVQLQFRIGETLSGQMENAVPITKEDHHQYVLLEGVKAEDTEGIKPQGTTPNEEEFIRNLENAARDELIAAVSKKVSELPQRIFDQAGRKERDGDMEGAAEAYLVYLNSTSAQQTPERTHAEHFLMEQFNMRPQASSLR